VHLLLLIHSLLKIAQLMICTSLVIVKGLLAKARFCSLLKRLCNFGSSFYSERLFFTFYSISICL